MPLVSSTAGLCLRRQNTDNLYLVGIRSDGRVGVRRRLAGSFNNLGASQAGLVTTGVWYTLRVELVGATMAVYLNDSLVISDSDSTHSSGSIGLCTVNTQARFDDVVVTTPWPDVSGSVERSRRDAPCKRAMGCATRIR